MAHPAQPKYITMTPLGRLCSEKKLSLAALANLAGSTSRTTMHRLLCGDLPTAYEHKVLKSLTSTLPQWLLAHGMSKSEIDAALTDIFPEGVYQPMINNRIELTPAECAWFNLKYDPRKDPFTSFPDSRDDVFICPPLQQIIDRVIDAIRYPAFISVTGPIGSGKTVIRAMVEDYVTGQPQIHIIWPEFMDQSRISAMQIARAVLRHFGANIPHAAEHLGLAVKKCLEREYKGGNRITIAFDEAHRLNDDALSSLKNFFEMGSGGFQRWVSILLFGQRMLDDRLQDEKFIEITERIVSNPMPAFREYSPAYMAHRLKQINADPDLFDDDAIAFISAQAETPQQLGNIANKALRITKDVFEERKVIGAAIRSEMFFANADTQSPAFRKRA